MIGGDEGMIIVRSQDVGLLWLVTKRVIEEAQVRVKISSEIGPDIAALAEAELTRISRVLNILVPTITMVMGQKGCRGVSMSEKHHNAGRIGGLQTWLRYGSDHMQRIACGGGRPTRQEAAERAWDTQKACQKRAGRRGH